MSDDSETPFDSIESQENDFVITHLAEMVAAELQDSVPVRVESDQFNGETSITITFKDAQEWHENHTAVTIACTRCGYEEYELLRTIKNEYTRAEMSFGDVDGNHAVCPECNAICSPELSTVFEQ